MKYFFTALLLFSAISAACSLQNSVTNDDARSGVNHNTAYSSAKNSNGMEPGGEMNHSQMKSSVNAASAPFDLQFLDTMIVHHQGALHMAKIAETKAENVEVKNLAKNIIAPQEKEITQMKSWREKSFGSIKPAVNMEAAGMNDSIKGMDMKKLESLSGKAFDLEFINQMIPHHEGAIMMAKDALQKSQNEQIKTLANNIIKEQEAEIKQMTEWKKN